MSQPLVDLFAKKNLTERDICTKFITPAIVETAGWDRDTQLKEELSLTKGKVIVRGKLHTRGISKRADYVLYHRTNIPLAVIEAKDNAHTIRSGKNLLGFKRARELGARTGTPVYVICDNRIVDLTKEDRRVYRRTVKRPHGAA